MSTLLWAVLVAIYIVCLVTLGVATFRKGHYAMFWLGIIFPLLWVIGALMAPTPAAIAREERAGIAGAP